MRGGTVLHKAHLAPSSRYSEDIDLVLTKPMDQDTLKRHLIRVLTPILGMPSPSVIADAWLALRNVVRPSKILRVVFKFIPLGLKREETIKVEVNLNEHQALYPFVMVDFQTLDEDGEDDFEANMRFAAALALRATPPNICLRWLNCHTACRCCWQAMLSIYRKISMTTIAMRLRHLSLPRAI
jgi:hypothetical protein